MKHAKCRMSPVAGVLLAVLLLWQAGLSGCDFSVPALYTATYMDVFDTVLTLRIASTSRTAADNAAAAVHARMLELHREFDIYHDWAGMNNLKTVNDHAGDGKPIPVSEDILNLLELGRVAFDFSDGQVNICMGSVLSLWHTARETETLPDAAALERAARHTAPHALLTDTAAGTVCLTDPDARLDVGAIAKGYAAACAADILRGRVESGELTGVLMELGGQALALGTRPDGSAWTVGVRDPRPDDGILREPCNLCGQGHERRDQRHRSAWLLHGGRCPIPPPHRPADSVPRHAVSVGHGFRTGLRSLPVREQSSGSNGDCRCAEHRPVPPAAGGGRGTALRRSRCLRAVGNGGRENHQIRRLGNAVLTEEFQP